PADLLEGPVLLDLLGSVLWRLCLHGQVPGSRTVRIEEHALDLGRHGFRHLGKEALEILVDDVERPVQLSGAELFLDDELLQRFVRYLDPNLADVLRLAVDLQVACRERHPFGNLSFLEVEMHLTWRHTRSSR